MPEIMDGKLITDFASVTIQNSNFGNMSDIGGLEGDKYDPGWIHLIHVSAETETGVHVKFQVLFF